MKEEKIQKVEDLVFEDPIRRDTTSVTRLGWIDHPEMGRFQVVWYNHYYIFIEESPKGNLEDRLVLRLKGPNGWPAGVCRENPGKLVVRTIMKECHVLEAVKVGGFNVRLSYEEPDYPKIKIVEEVDTELITQKGEVENMKNYFSSTGELVLDEYNTERIRIGMARLYRKMDYEASTRDCFIQPLVVRYKYLNREKRVLYKSPLHVFRAPSGFQFTQELQCDMNTFKKHFETTVEGFSVRLELPEADPELRREIDKIVFETVYLINAINLGGMFDLRYEIDPDDRILRTYMPQVKEDKEATLATMESLLREATLHFEELCEETAMIYEPFVWKEEKRSLLLWDPKRNSANSRSDDLKRKFEFQRGTRERFIERMLESWGPESLSEFVDSERDSERSSEASSLQGSELSSAGGRGF